MRYSIEPRDKIYVKRYGFSSFSINMSNKHSQKLLNSAKECATNAIKTASKRPIQKIAEATGDLIGNKSSGKITSILKFPKELDSKELYSKTDENEIEISKERYVSPETDKKLLMN